MPSSPALQNKRNRENKRNINNNLYKKCLILFCLCGILQLNKVKAEKGKLFLGPQKNNKWVVNWQVFKGLFLIRLNGLVFPTLGLTSKQQETIEKSLVKKARGSGLSPAVRRQNPPTNVQQQMPCEAQGMQMLVSHPISLEGTSCRPDPGGKDFGDFNHLYTCFVLCSSTQYIFWEEGVLNRH